MHRLMRCQDAFCLFVIAVLAITMAGCASSSSHSVGVTITQGASASLDNGQTKTLAATVANDSKSAGVAWAISSGPGTLSGSTTSGTTYNAPASGATATATVTATSVSDTSKSASITIHISPVPAIAPTPEPGTGTNGSAFTYSVPVSGGTTPLTWSISAGALPSGLTLNQSGVVSGTPNADATQSPYAFTVKVQDAATVAATQDYSLTINNPPAPVIATSAPPAGTNGTAYAAFTFTLASGGLAPFTWSETGALPTGMTLTTAGKLSGTPTQAGSFAITVSVQDSSNPKQTASQGFTIQVNNPQAPSISPTSLPDGAVGTPYSQTIQANNGLAPYSWAVSAGTPPAGLALGTPNANFVPFSGTPTTAQTNVQFTVTVTDSLSQTGSQTYTMNIAAQPIIVTISPKFSTVQAGAANAKNLTATVQHDTQGVSWTLTANGSDCSPTCGQLSNVTSTSVTYTPPDTVPSAPNNAPVITATSVTDNTKSDTDSFTITNVSAACTAQGNEAILNGQYAFSLAGYNNSGFGVLAGSLTIASGHITAGELDMNGAIGSQTKLSIDTSGSSYSVGSDNRGCLVIATSAGNFTTRITVGSVSGGVAAKGRILEWETGSSAFIATGQLLQQQTSAFSAGLNGSYVFAMAGEDTNSQSGPVRIACTGVLPAAGGSFGVGVQDCNDGGNMQLAGALSGGSYSSLDSSGRGTGSVVSSNGTSNIAIYMVDSSKLLMMGTDTTGVPFYAAEMRAQSGTFNNASLTGISVFYLSGVDGSGANGDAILGLFTGNNGSAGINLYEDDGGTISNHSPSSGCSYSVASNGRATMSGTDCKQPPVLYLTAARTGLMMGTGSVISGAFEPQAAGPFNNSSVSGTFFAGTGVVPSQSAEPGVGYVTLTNGSVAGVSDNTSTTDQSADSSFSDTYSIDSNGWVTLSGDSDPTLVVISGSKLVKIDPSNSSDLIPMLMIMEK